MSTRKPTSPAGRRRSPFRVCPFLEPIPVGTLGSNGDPKPMTRSYFPLAALAALVAAGVVPCAVHPATGSRQRMLLGAPHELARGREYAQAAAACIGLDGGSGRRRSLQQ